MSQSRTMDRRFVILGAILMQLSLGAIYAWSVFTPALKAAGWSKLDTQLVFALGLVSFAVVMVGAGRALTRFGPQRLAVAGGLTLGFGYVLAGLLGADHFWAVMLGIGLIGGSGIGLGYVVPIAVGMRWFPDKKGMITGLAVAGFGFGAMGWVKIAGAWGHLIENSGLAATFIIYGIAFAALILIGSIWMRMPPKGWKPEGYNPPPQMAGSGGEDFTVAEMLRTPQFYLIFLTFAASAGAGLMSIGLMKLYPMEALQAAGYGAVEASAIAGTAMAVSFSLANGLGRIIWGTLSDRLGRKRSVIIMTASQAVFLFAFTYMAGNAWLLYLGAALIGFNFGGNFALFPTLTADIFGTNRVGQNYPLVFLSYGVGGIAGPVLGGMLGDMGNFPLAFSVCAGACLAGSALTALVLTPDHEEATHHASVHGFIHQLHLDHLEEVVDHAIHPDHYKRIS
ncbi:MAG: MFS transporter [Hyphomicrobiales bacterium]|nr:MAG: MFS transporter [Hyphomicrobiales bacterium]